MSAGYFNDRSKLYLSDLFSGLVSANHILHNNGVLDGYGHVSVRNPDAPKESFFMSYALAPALVASQDDLVQYRIDDGEAVEAVDDSKKGFVERYIHSELYKRFPNVNCVVHSHAPEVLPFGVSGVPLKPAIHTAAFLGTDVPVWDINSAYSSGDAHDMLVRNTKLGASLAHSFVKPATSVNFITSKLAETLTGSQTGPSTTPEYPVVLMRGHGFTVAGPGIEEAVYMAIYAAQAAKIQYSSLTLCNAYFGAKIEGSVDTEHGGKIKNGTAKNTREPQYLSSREAKDATETMWSTVQRPWALWKREVQAVPLYINSVKPEDAEKE